MAEDKDILLRIKVDSEKALKAVIDYTQELERLKEKQRTLKGEMNEIIETERELAKQYKEGKISTEQYAQGELKLTQRMKAKREEMAVTQAQTAQTAQALRGYQKELQNIVKQEETNNGSLVSLRAELSNTTKAYDELSRAEREGAKGTELLNHINALTDEINEAEQATQRFYRNVGNYKSALEGAGKAAEGLKDGVLGFASAGNPMLQMLLNTATQLGSVKQAFGVVVQGAKMAGKQFMALMANPIVAFLAAIVAAFMALKKGLESSEERMNKFRVLLAPLQGVLDAVSNALGVFCGWLLELAELSADAIMWLAKLGESLPLIGDAIKEGNAVTKEYIELEKERQAMMKRTRDNIVLNAEAEREISDLKAKFAEKDKYTNEERLAFLERTIAIERKLAEERKSMAEKNFELLKREAALSDNNEEMLNKLAEAEAAVINADKELNDKLRELNGQRAEAINAIKAENDAEVKAAEDKRKRAQELAKERARLETEAVRAAEDALNQLITDNIEKRKKLIATEYDREIEELRRRLAEETNLTLKARNAINTQIIALEQQKNKELSDIDREVAEAKAKADAEAAEKAKSQRIKQQQDAMAEAALDLSIKIEQLHGDEAAILEAKKQAKLHELMTMQQLESESEKEFELRRLEAKNEYFNMEKEIADRQIEIEKNKRDAQVKAYNDVMSAMEAMGEHSKLLGKLAKVMGLAQIAVDTGKAISAGVASASGVPFPANLAAIATTVATVLTNMATAMSSIKSAKFATGGLVEGAGSGTSDSIPALLSNGESVMTAAATSAFAPLLSTINQMGGGVPIDIASIGSQQMGEEMLARAVAKGVSSLRPVVSVEEINRVSANVQVIESLATL